MANNKYKVEEMYPLDAISLEDGYMESGTADPNSQLAVDFCGFQHCRPGHTFGPLARSPFIIHTVIQGKGILKYRGKTYEITSGQAFILLPGEMTLYSADNVDPWYYCWIGFHGTEAEQIVKAAGFSKENPVVTLQETHPLEEIVLQLIQYKDLSYHDWLLRTSCLCQYLAHIISSNTQERINETKGQFSAMSYAEYAAKYIRIHFREKLRISELADHIGISRSYLGIVMKEAYGMTPHEYLVHVRMDYAAHMLNHTDDSIRDVAVGCGYDDPLAFSKAFKQMFGINPGEFRKYYREGNRTENEGPYYEKMIRKFIIRNEEKD